MCSKNITQDFVILSRISSLLTNLEISWHYFRANIPQPYRQAIIMLITYVSWKNSMKPSCDNIHLPGESFIFYDISQVIAPLHTVSITVRTPVISEDSPLYYERDQAGDSHICTQLYWQRGLKHSSHFTPPAGRWSLVRIWFFASLIIDKDSSFCQTVVWFSAVEENHSSPFLTNLPPSSLLGKLNTYLLPLHQCFSKFSPPHPHIEDHMLVFYT